MNRSRKSNKGLPRRVYLKHGAYYFFSPEAMRDPTTGAMKKWIQLGYEYEGEAVMLQALANLLKDKKSITGTMPYVCAEFKANKLKKYTPAVQSQYRQYLDVIADDFEDFQVTQVTTKHCADFLRNKFRDKPNTARKYSALMRKVFKYAISELGVRQDNPVDQLDLGDYETERRTVLPTHEQVQQIRQAGMYSKPRKDTGKVLPTASGPMFACLIDMSYLCWQRAIDVRTLKESQIEDGRMRFKPSKTEKSSGKTIDILVTPQIQAVIDRARDIKKRYGVISPYLMPTQKGKPYTKSGLFSMWDRARDRLGIDKDSPPELRIQFKDLRALGATDAAKSGRNISEIQTRLAHTSSKTSEIYIKESVPETSGIDLKLPWKTV